MISVVETRAFSKWMDRLDSRDRGRIAARLRMAAAQAHFGDHKSVGGGVHEMRFHFGPGYRVYYTWKGGQMVIILAGGDKSSQQRDIAKAQSLAREI